MKAGLLSLRALCAAGCAAALACAGKAPVPASPASANARPAAKPSSAAPPPGAAGTQGARTEAAVPALATPDDAFRQTKPAPLAEQSPFAAPVPAQVRLKNGARLLVVENHNVPVVAVTVLIPAGTNADPLEQPGLADFVANMLDEGTASRTAPQLSEAIENLAARLSASAGPESIQVSLNSLKDTLPQALELLADVLMNPAFRAPDLERVRGLMLTDLLQKAANPALLARDEMARRLWGPRHPWGQPAGGTPQSIAAIGADDLRRFHQTWFRPNGAIVAVAGDVSAAEARALLEERFAAWKPGPLPAHKLPPPPRLRARALSLVDKPTASQSQVWVAGRIFPAGHPDRVPLRVANFILGGLFGSRLNMNLRENKGYSYGVRSQVSLLRSAGTLLAAGGIAAKSTPEALVEYEKELRDFSTGEVTDEELAKAKEAYVRSLPSALETDDAIAQSMAALAFNGLPLDEYKTLPERIARVTRADVRRVARRWIKPAAWPVVIVGPREGNEEKLRALDLGPLEVSEPANGGASSAARPGSAK